MARIENLQQLREIYAEPKGRSLLKEITHLETHSKRFIELSPFVLLSTQGTNNGADVSPRGEHPGFVQVLDDKTIAIPDRPGNNRLDSLQNILENPRVGLIFLVPGVDETLRINGRAEIRTDAELMDRFVENGKPPKSVLVVSVDEVYLQCAKALMRAGLWNPDNQIERRDLPTMSRMIGDMAGSGGGDVDEESHDDMIARYSKVLY